MLFISCVPKRLQLANAQTKTSVGIHNSANVFVILDFIDVKVPGRPIKRLTLDFLLGKAEKCTFCRVNIWEMENRNSFCCEVANLGQKRRTL